MPSGWARTYPVARRLCSGAFVAGLLQLGLGAQALAQTPVEPSNLVSLSASGLHEVQQDWLSMSLNTIQEGPDPQTVQNQLKYALDAALVVARAAARPQDLEVKTGAFGLYPRYGSNGKITGWQGRAELVLEGRDFARISDTAGKIPYLTMGQANFSLSRAARQKLEAEVQSMAIERFKQRAGDIAHAFGFSTYVIREVSVSSADQDSESRPRVMTMQAKAALSDTPVPAEAGRSVVSVTVSGTVQMR